MLEVRVPCFYIWFNRAPEEMAFSPPTPKTATMRLKAVLFQERKADGRRIAILRLIIARAPNIRWVGCTDVHKLLTAIARIGRVADFQGDRTVTSSRFRCLVWFPHKCLPLPYESWADMGSLGLW